MCHLCDTSTRLISRRFVLGAGAAFACGASLAAMHAKADVDPAAPNAIPPDAALARLAAGNARYASSAPMQADYSLSRVARAKAQYPIAAVLSCADSRVVPELAFDQGPGQLFVVRVAGNFVDSDGLASLEYGVRFLGVPLIVVLGHSNCGAVAAAVKVVQEGTKLPGHLANLVQNLTPAVRIAIAANPAANSQDLLAAAIRENVRQNVAELRADQPIIADQVAGGKLKIAGGVYDIATGKITLL